MTTDEFERRKQLMLEQRAQFAAGMQQLREAQAHTERVVTQTEETIARFERKMREGFKEGKAKIDAFIESQMQTENALRNLRASLDRYFKRHRNEN
jgi:DNA-directed RNA polymerase beta' subunit